MNDDTVIHLVQPDQIDDALTDVLRLGAARLLAVAIEAEVEAHLAAHADLKLPDGRQRLVRHGSLPAREVQTGIGAVKVQVPRVRDRADSNKTRFQSSILPQYIRRTKYLKTLISWLYLKGISTGNFQEALSTLLGPDAANLSAVTISRLTKTWAHQDLG